MKLRLLSLNLLSLGFLLLPLVLFAQGSGDPPTRPPGGGTGDPPISIHIENPVKNAGNLYEFINLIIENIVLPLGAVIAVLYIMYAGFLLVTARGDTKQIEDGRRAFTNAAIGTAILLGAWAIAKVIEATLHQITG